MSKGKWTNKEFDSTVAVFGVFIAFSLVTGTILALVLRSMEVSPDIIIVFQGCKELVLIILAYFFGRRTQNQPPDPTNEEDQQ